MIKKLLLIVSVFCCVAAQAQTYKWIKGGGSAESMSPSANYERTNHMCTDDNGNVYATTVVGALDIEADTFYMAIAHNSYSSTPHILLTSYRCDGTMRWAKLIESENYALAGGLAYLNGNIYLTGSMIGTNKHVGYDTVMGSYNLSSFTMRIDTSGQFRWIKFVGPDDMTTSLTANAPGVLAIDRHGYVHSFNLIGAGCEITSTFTAAVPGTYDIKYDTLGNLISVNMLPAMDSLWRITKVVFSPTDDKYYATLLPDDSYWYGVYSSPNYAVASFLADGTQVWRDTTGSNGFILGFDYKGGNAIYVAGSVSSIMGPLFLGGIGVTDTLFPGYESSFIYRLDTNGTAQWVYNLQGNGSLNEFVDLVILPNAKVAVTGYFYGKLKHGTDSVVCPTATEHVNPSFVEIDSSGHTVKLDQLHGPGLDDQGYCIACDHTGNIFLGGSLTSTLSATGLTPYSTVGGNTDFYVVKYGYNCGCTTIPTANFTSAGTATVSFTYTGSTGYDSVRWYFGDGGTSTVGSPAHAYTLSGTYHACVTVYTSCGSDTYCSDIVVTVCTPPVANFTSTGTTTATFTYTGTPGYDSVRWYFGDGGTSTVANPTHTFTASGTYTICVTAYKPCGSNTHCSTITVCIVPVANFTSTGTSTASFTYTGTTGYDSVRWYFGDGGTSTVSNPTHSYTANGTYTVCVTAYKPCGSNTHCSTITVCLAPVPSFTSVGTFSVNFTYTGTTAYDSLRWRFGDGGTSTVANPTHLYTLAGTYHICVKVYNSCGSDSACADKTVSVGVAGVHTQDVKIYPNPSSDELVIEGAAEGTLIRMMDMTGREVYRGVTSSNLHRVDMSKVPAATYMVRLEYQGEVSSRMVVKE